ncbi:MAG: site-specific integrase [Faecalibacterium sp.]|nr:site-specific integrase [Faecalibacterium sp.]
METIAKPMTRKSMREYAMFIRSTLEYADENYGVKNPMHKIPALGSRSRSVDTIKKHQIKQLQDTLKESSMLEQVIVLSLLNSGVRRGELAGLTWKDVNFEECTIHISKSFLVFKDYGYQLTTTKESNIRDVDVAPEFMAFLKDYHEQWKSRKKLMGASWQKNLEKKGAKYAQSLLDLRGNDFVICNDYGFPINPDSYAALVRRVGKKAGIEKIHPHMFRHTFVSILLSNPNIGVATVAAEAGHAQPSTTLAIYTQVYDRRRDEIRKQMSKELYK